MEETKERRALRKLVEILHSRTKTGVFESDDGVYDGACSQSVVVMSEPKIVSAMYEAAAILGIKIKQ